MTDLSKEPPAAAGDAFVPHLVHELRNRLAPIRNAVHLLRKRFDDDEQGRWALEIIERQTNQLNDTIEALADLSKLARATMVLRNRDFDLRATIAAAAGASAAALQARRQSLDVSRLAPSLTVRGDGERIEQSLRVLILAVARYAVPGARIELRCAVDQDQDILDIVPIPSTGETHDSAKGASALPHELGLQVVLAQRVLEMHGGSLAATLDAAGALHCRIRLPQSPPASG